jgi:NitT/TauT family transport system substrate-binding protein
MRICGATSRRRRTVGVVDGRDAMRARAGLAAAAVLGVVLAGCGGGGEEVVEGAGGDGRFDLTGTTIRVGAAQEQTLDLGFSYALEVLEGWGAEVQRESLTNVSGLEAIVADRVDIAARSSDELITGISRGVGVQAIGAPVSKMHYAFVGTEDVADVAALRGTQIAISGPGGFDTLLIRALLEDRGIDPERDVTLVPIGGSSERTAALLAGQVSGAVVFMDNWFALQHQSESLRLIGYLEDLVPGLSARAIFAERTFLEQNPELATAIACANLEANRWVVNDRAAFIDLAQERVRGADEEAVAEFHDAAIQLGLYPTDPRQVLTTESYAATVDLMLREGAIDAPVDPAQVVQTRYLEEAAARGCGG